MGAIPACTAETDIALNTIKAKIDLFITLKEGGKAAGPYVSLAAAKAAGAVTLNWGFFINTVISFLIVAFAVFLVVKGMNKLQKEEAPPPPDTKECPFCYSAIPIQASRCPHCTSELAPAAATTS